MEQPKFELGSDAVQQHRADREALRSFPFLTHYPELTLDKWAKRFGDLYSVWLGQQLVVVISSPDVAKDLMVTRGAICSSRKDMYIKSQCVFAGRGITVTPYNDMWRKHRRIASAWLHQKAVDKFSSAFDREATDMANCLLEASHGGCSLVNPQPFAGRCSLNDMLTIVFGARTASVQDPLVSTALRLAREFIQKLHHLVKTYGDMIESIHRRWSRGQEAPDCLATALLTMREEEELDDLDMVMMASAFMIGGVESLGTPHVASEDFVYNGQLIPKDTVLVLNTWTIHHDEGRFPEPEQFNPDHYVNDSLSSAQSSKLSDADQRDHWMFGAGRRICPAILVAEREIFLAISRILWSFTMEAEPGHPVDLKEYDGLSGRSPLQDSLEG
ncbi:cytochrome P450 [Metarhizium acridum CQMa 102]|uniref:Cytochrome P450 n=1 Tax=Metarhizium acridum (strain CQMa 102) TaxID=655827 RepID=E9DWW0_METAQ|nr:cytochrome P450 [Metarhizium acridum CQMa 102]EFY91823.1 cytochrome P450 [Metarhizium acridum CQMa 102]